MHSLTTQFSTLGCALARNVFFSNMIGAHRRRSPPEGFSSCRLFARRRSAMLRHRFTALRGSGKWIFARGCHFQLAMHQFSTTEERDSHNHNLATIFRQSFSNVCNSFLQSRTIPLFFLMMKFEIEIQKNIQRSWRAAHTEIMEAMPVILARVVWTDGFNPEGGANVCQVFANGL